VKSDASCQIQYYHKVLDHVYYDFKRNYSQDSNNVYLTTDTFATCCITDKNIISDVC